MSEEVSVPLTPAGAVDLAAQPQPMVVSLDGSVIEGQSKRSLLEKMLATLAHARQKWGGVAVRTIFAWATNPIPRPPGGASQKEQTRMYAYYEARENEMLIRSEFLLALLQEGWICTSLNGQVLYFTPKFHEMFAQLLASRA